MYGNQHAIATLCAEVRQQKGRTVCADPRCHRCFGLRATRCQIPHCRISPPQPNPTDIVVHCQFCETPGGELLFVGPTTKALDVFLRHMLLEHFHIIATLHETYTGLIPHLIGTTPWTTPTRNPTTPPEWRTNHGDSIPAPAPSAPAATETTPAHPGKTTPTDATSD